MTMVFASFHTFKNNEFRQLLKGLQSLQKKFQKECFRLSVKNISLEVSYLTLFVELKLQ